MRARPLAPSYSPLRCALSLIRIQICLELSKIRKKKDKIVARTFLRRTIILSRSLQQTRCSKGLYWFKIVFVKEARLKYEIAI